MTRIYVFPGQGSQKLGMGADLFARFPEQVDEADAELGFSIVELCLRDPQKQLNLTQFTQPALFVVDALAFLNRLVETGEMPHFVAGHSLGEYSALFAAGVFDFRTGVKLVRQRGALMSRASGGAMTAVVGLAPDRIRQLLSERGLGSIDIANLNSPSQTVISGLAKDLEPCQALLEQAGALMVKPLPVSAAFHSRYMADAEREFAGFLDDFELRAPRIPVLSNVTGKPHEPPLIRTMLARQITQPVRWSESVQWLLQQPEPEFSELGPGNVLTGLIRQIKKETGTAEIRSGGRA